MRNTILFAIVAFIAAGAATIASQNLSSAIPQKPVVAAETIDPARPVRLILLAGRGGHFDVGATVDKTVLNFVVDTGASLVALNYRDAERIGLKLKPSDFKNPVRTANGVTHAANVILPSIKIKGIQVNNVAAMVLPAGALETNLLGNSFLSRLKSYEVRSGQLTMEQ